ncbi:hypothetical protein JXB02_02605 [Candidatus Woesearchaeota archaeon]|nr:hypothetical protein [Candidatus Woesearchaeota archaeon]
MRAVVFDTGPIISLALNNLLDVLPSLRKAFGGPFLIPPSVRREVIDRPLHSKKFKFEAHQVLAQLRAGSLEERDATGLDDRTRELLDSINTVFYAHDNPIRIVHYAEASVLELARIVDAVCVVIDERTTRLVLEDPKRIHLRLQNKLHTKVRVDTRRLRQVRQRLKGMRAIRSVELVTAAFELGLLDSYLADIPDAKRELLDSILWGVKLNGCSVSDREIRQIIRLEGL